MTETIRTEIGWLLLWLFMFFWAASGGSLFFMLIDFFFVIRHGDNLYVAVRDRHNDADN